MSRSVLVGVVSFVLSVLLVLEARALTIRSWDGANQLVELGAGNAGPAGYSFFETALTSRSHNILPGISVLTPANLAGVDVFYWGESPNVGRTLNATEAIVLSNFIQAGGKLIVESNSGDTDRSSANSALSALGLGNPYNGTIGGGISPNAGLFAGIMSPTLVGPLGDLRGLTFGSSTASDISPGLAGAVVGNNGAVRTWIEFDPFGNGPQVLAMGDPFGQNFFGNPVSPLFNPNNTTAILNFIEMEMVNPNSGGVPEPVTPVLFGLGAVVILSCRRR